MRLLLFFASALALGACSQCPEGHEMAEWEVVTCDEATRTCTFESQRGCRCTNAECRLLERRPPTCEAISGVQEWLAQDPLPNEHVVDGAFTGDEWTGATALQGLFTDVYLDYRDGRLYFLNDWRANDEGIRPECFNYFQIRVGLEWIDLKVFGDGRVSVRRDGVDVSQEVRGAYGFHASPALAAPHTIYEFSLAADVSQIDICCFDPLNMSSCDELGREPMVVSIRQSGGGGAQVLRTVRPGTVARLAADAPCGDGQGICQDGLRCTAVEGDVHRCLGEADPPPTPDAGPPSLDAGAPPD